LVGLVVYFSLSTSAFFSKSNGFQIVRSASVLLVIAIGATMVIVAGSIDLSVGSVAQLTGTIAAWLSVHAGATSVWVALVVGIACGFVNGVLVSYARLPSFLVTLGTLFVFDGLANKIAVGSSIGLSSPFLENAGNGTSVGGIPNLGFWALTVLLVVGVLAQRTKFGRHIYAIGGNERVAQLTGVPVQRAKLLVFMLSGFMGGVAGLMLIARGGGSSPGMGSPFLLQSIAAIVMGGTSLFGGTGGPLRTLLGVFTIVVLTNGMIIAEVDSYTQTMIQGLVVIAAVAVTIRRAELAAVK
jgi:ribose transport system permease protein/putative xylitol transport system permease protein